MNTCEICGKSRNRKYDHTACSKAKQAQHAEDKRPKRRVKMDYERKQTLEHFSKL